jgi:hypothetical protein
MISVARGNKVNPGFQGYMAHEFVPAGKDPMKSLELAVQFGDA